VKPPSLLQRTATWLAAGALKLLGGTLRWHLVDEAGYRTRPLSEPLLVASWHNRILVLPLCYAWICRGRRPLTVLTSASRDGGFLSEFVARFGIGAVRGSSSRRGTAALRELQATLASGKDVIITPDGPRGPVYSMSSGLVFLAQKTGIPVMLLHVDYSAYWELKSWDGFRVPKPFSSVRVRMLRPCTVPAVEDAEMLERERKRLEDRLSGSFSEAPDYLDAIASMN
jgi:lysophospholipid acyltransferase (LPLAT)-like uncharacterized protein